MSPGCYQFVSFTLHLLLLVCDMAQFYLTGVYLVFLEDRGQILYSKIRAILCHHFTFIGQQLKMCIS